VKTKIMSNTNTTKNTWVWLYLSFHDFSIRFWNCSDSVAIFVFT